LECRRQHHSHDQNDPQREGSLARLTSTAWPLQSRQINAALMAERCAGPQRWQNVRVSTSALGATRARIVTAFLRDGNRVLLCHRSPQRRRYPDVWDLPGGHVEPGELPGAALARELHEELGIDVAVPAGPPMQQIHADTFDMQIWLIESWTGTPVNVALDEHDAIAWFQEDELGELRLAHDSYLAMFTEALAVR
jgi:8-oxo-dGTP pyrophosphatase MutT (NUDIX family)